MELVELGKKIKEARLKAGLNQQQLADKISTTNSVISEIEKGKRNPSFEVLNKIATALKAQLLIEFLFTEKDKLPENRNVK